MEDQPRASETNDTVVKATISALNEIKSPSNRCFPSRQHFPQIIVNKFQEILPKFSSPLKTNFENRNLWLRFGLTLLLSKKSSQSALQAFIECMRIDQEDPLPAMLAAKLLLEDLDDPEKGLDFIKQAIDRCKRLDTIPKRLGSISSFSSVTSMASSSPPSPKSETLKQSQNNEQATPSKLLSSRACNYKNIAPLLSRCYLLAGVMHAYIHERKPASIRTFDMFTMNKTSLEESQIFLDLAIETHQDHLIYFHKALHEAKKRSYQSAIDNLRQAVGFNPHHLPSMQLLILSLSAIGHLQDALILCESSLHEFEDNLLLLYVKCNLEQRLVETKGYKSALDTVKHMMRCIKQTGDNSNFSRGTSSTTTATLAANSIGATTINLATTTAAPQMTNATTASLTGNMVLPSPISLDLKQPSSNLFAEDNNDCNETNEFVGCELSIWLLVAEIFVKIGSIEDAELCVDEGSIYANGALSHKVMFVRGLIAKAKHNLMEAKMFFQSCLALCPRHAKALQQLAHVHYLLGNYSSAEKFLRDSLDADSTYSKSWDYLRLVCIELKQHDRAKKCEQEFEALEESSPVVPISIISHLTFL